MGKPFLDHPFVLYPSRGSARASTRPPAPREPPAGGSPRSPRSTKRICEKPTPRRRNLPQDGEITLPLVFWIGRRVVSSICLQEPIQSPKPLIQKYSFLSNSTWVTLNGQKANGFLSDAASTHHYSLVQAGAVYCNPFSSQTQARSTASTFEISRDMGWPHLGSWSCAACCV